MNKKALEAFAAKGIKTEQDPNELRQMLSKVTLEHCLILNAELDDHLGTINGNPQPILITVTAPPVRLCVPKVVNFD